MPKWFRFLFVSALPLSILAACGTDREPASPVDTSLDLSGVAQFCPSGDISEAIAAIFPTTSALRNVATVNCGQVFDAFGKGKQTEAVQKFLRFFARTMQQYENNVLLDPDPSLEVKIADLFNGICANIGCPLGEIDPAVLASGEYAVGTLFPDGPPVLTVSKHAGIVGNGGLLGQVDVVIFQIFAEDGGVDLELASESHPCPAGVDNSFDCYPLFFDYSVFPESNVDTSVGLRLGQCNVSPEGVEVQLLSPEGFLPLDDAPAGIDCTDVEPEEITMTGWRSYAWAVIEPISPLLRVAPLFAGQSPLGGRISNFSPVAAADPESGVTLGSISGQVTDGESALQGALVELSTDGFETVEESTTTNADGNYSFAELNLGTYEVRASLEGYISGSSGPVVLTEEDPDAENVNTVLEPIIIP